LQNDRPIVHPDWTQINQHGWNNPRDLYLPLGNEIMEAPGSRRSRYYEYLGLRPLVEKWFKEDPDFLWTAAPRPWLSDESYKFGYYWDYAYVWDEETKKEKMLNWDYHLTEKEPLWDAADAARAGKDIFWQASALTNRAGMEWLRRYLSARGFRLHAVQFDSSSAGYYRPWHIDVVVNMLRPGLMVVSNKKHIMDPKIVDLFRKNDWEIVQAVDPEYQWNETFTLSATPQGKGVQGPNWISMNTFSLSPKEICVSDKEHGYMEQLNKLGVEVIPVSYDKVYKFGGMLHCTTLDVYREGKCEDYFPNQ
ncbi:MAG: serine/threonine protein kinase, partial [Desulfovibrionaceae bacterium]|nr:serine/threonine protein kinase [Desulfovibrionaceae bacterium]